MQTSKVYIFRDKETELWQVGVIVPLNDEMTFINKHEAATWEEAGNWVRDHYVG